MTRQQRIVQRLSEILQPTHLEVVDESRLHAGHAGARPEGETHYRVVVASAAFAGKNRVACHRMVNDALKEEFARGLHALGIVIG